MTTAAALFRTLGTSIAIPGNVPFLPDQLHALGFRWASPKVQHGTEFEYTRQGSSVQGQSLDDVVARYHAAHLSVPGWGFLVGADPEGEGSLAAQLVRQHNLDAYIANLETTAPAYSVDDSKRFVAAFRATAPSVPLAVQVLGAAVINPATGKPWGYPFDVRPWLDAGAEFLPEAYWSLHGPVSGADAGYEPLNTFLEWHEVLGVPVERIHPTIGLWGATGLATVAEYLTDLRAAQQRWPTFKGVNHYILEQTRIDELAMLSNAVTLGLADAEIAVSPPPPPPPAPTPDPTATKAVMVTLARGMEQQWVKEGKSGITIRRTRIGTARRLLETAAWTPQLADEIARLLG